MIQTDNLHCTGHAGHFVGHATLDNAKALNALNHPMAIALLEAIETWQADPNCVAILLSGAGDKAFCAGGDVKYVTRRQPGESDADRIGRANDYFECEYRLDQALHESAKPVIVWGDGIVMGGGMGLLQGASHRLVTERSVLSMPETAIGFFPDVGASWFLNRVSLGLGPLLGVSGAHLSGSDAIFLNLADHLVSHELFERLKNALTQADWFDRSEANHGVVSYTIESISPALHQAHESEVAHHQQTLTGLRDAPTLHHRIEGLKALANHSSPWMQKLAATTAKGSPFSMCIADQHIRRHRHSSLSECFAADAKLAARLVAHPEFAEGVRAVLIDKDQTPKWSYPDIPSVPESRINEMLQS